MKLHDILEIIQTTAKKNNLSSAYIVGGVPRDRVRGVVKEIKDIDLTTENGDAVELAFACLKVLPYTYFKLYDDGHAAFNIGTLQIDFSNHFIIPNIEEELKRINVVGKTPLIKETYSRDFTINTLLQDLNFESIYDITNYGIKDINSGIIRCPIDPNITLKYDPKRILRALRFAVKFNFNLQEDLIRAINNQKHLLKTLSPELVKTKINNLLDFNDERAIKLLINLDLLDYIPHTKQIYDALIKYKLLYDVLE